MSDLKLFLRVITPSGIIYEDFVFSVKFSRKDGLMVIYKNYSSVLEQLSDGKIVIDTGSKKITLNVENAWLTVSDNKCNIYSTLSQSI